MNAPNPTSDPDGNVCESLPNARRTRRSEPPLERGGQERPTGAPEDTEGGEASEIEQVPGRCPSGREHRGPRGNAHAAGPQIHMWGSELPVIAGLSALFGNDETGGDIWGDYSRERHAVVSLVTGPGPEAVHQGAHYSQDYAFWQRMQQRLWERYGLEWLGAWHAHQGLGISRPSHGDVSQTHAMARRNPQLDRWYEIITTQDVCSRKGRGRGSKAWLRRVRAPRPNIRLHAFVYLDPRQGEPAEIPVRVLPGFSPYREALLSRGELAPEAIAQPFVDFDMDRVLVDCVESEPASEPCHGVPDGIVEQIAGLPIEAQEGVAVDAGDEDITVTVELARGRALAVAFRSAAPHRVLTVRVGQSDAGRWMDVSQHVRCLEIAPRLPDIYAFVVSHCGAANATGSAAKARPRHGGGRRSR